MAKRNRSSANGKKKKGAKRQRLDSGEAARDAAPARPGDAGEPGTRRHEGDAGQRRRARPGQQRNRAGGADENARTGVPAPISYAHPHPHVPPQHVPPQHVPLPIEPGAVVLGPRLGFYLDGPYTKSGEPLPLHRFAEGRRALVLQQGLPTAQVVCWRSNPELPRPAPSALGAFARPAEPLSVQRGTELQMTVREFRRLGQADSHVRVVYSATVTDKGRVIHTTASSHMDAVSQWRVKDRQTPIVAARAQSTTHTVSPRVSHAAKEAGKSAVFHALDGVATALLSTDPDKVAALKDQVPIVLEEGARDAVVTFLQTMGGPGSKLSTYGAAGCDVVSGLVQGDYLMAGDGAIGLALSAALHIPVHSTLLQGEQYDINAALLADGDFSGSLSRRGVSAGVPVAVIPLEAGVHGQDVTISHSFTAADGTGVHVDQSVKTLGVHASVGRTADASLGVGMASTTTTSTSSDAAANLQTQKELSKSAPAVAATFRLSDRLGTEVKSGPALRTTTTTRDRRLDGQAWEELHTHKKWGTPVDGANADPAAIAAGAHRGSIESTESVMEHERRATKTLGVTHKTSYTDVGVREVISQYDVNGVYGDTEVAAGYNGPAAGGAAQHSSTSASSVLPGVPMDVEHRVSRVYPADRAEDDFGSDGQFRDERGSHGATIFGKRTGETTHDAGTRRSEENVRFAESRTTVSRDGKFVRQETGAGNVGSRTTVDGKQTSLDETTAYRFTSAARTQSHTVSADGRSSQASSSVRVKHGGRGTRHRELADGDAMTRVTEDEAAHVRHTEETSTSRKGFFSDKETHKRVQTDGKERLRREGTEARGEGSNMRVTFLEYADLERSVQETSTASNVFFSRTVFDTSDAVADALTGELVETSSTHDVSIELSVHSKAARNAIAASVSGDVVRLLVSTTEGKPSLGQVTRSLGEAGAQAFLTSVLSDKMAGVLDRNAGAIASGMVGASFALLHGDSKAAAQAAVRTVASVAADEALTAIGAREALRRVLDVPEGTAIGSFSAGRSHTSASGQLFGSGVIASSTDGYEVSMPVPGVPGLNMRVGLDHEQTVRRRRNGAIVHTDSRGIGAGVSCPATASSATVTLGYGHEHMEPRTYQHGNMTVTEMWDNKFVGRLSFRANIGNRQLNLRLLPDFYDHSVKWEWRRRTDGAPMRTSMGSVGAEAADELRSAALRLGQVQISTPIAPRPLPPDASLDSSIAIDPVAAPPVDVNRGGTDAASATAVGETAAVSSARDRAATARSEWSSKTSRRDDVMSTGVKEDRSAAFLNAKTKRRYEHHEIVRSTDTSVEEGTHVDDAGLRHDTVRCTEIVKERDDITKVETRKKSWFTKPKWTKDTSSRTVAETKLSTTVATNHMTTRADGSDLDTRHAKRRVEPPSGESGPDGASGYTETTEEHDRALMTDSRRTQLHTKGNAVTENVKEDMYGHKHSTREYDTVSLSDEVDDHTGQAMDVSRTRRHDVTSSYVDARLRDGKSYAAGENRVDSQALHEQTTTMDVEQLADGGAFHEGTLSTDREVAGVKGSVSYTVNMRVRRHETESRHEAARGNASNGDRDVAGSTASEGPAHFEQRETLDGFGSFLVRGTAAQTSAPTKVAFGSATDSLSASMVRERTQHVVGSLEARLGEDTRAAASHEAVLKEVAHAKDGGVTDANAVLNPTTRITWDDTVYTPNQDSNEALAERTEEVGAAAGGGTRKYLLARQCERDVRTEALSSDSPGGNASGQTPTAAATPAGGAAPRAGDPEAREGDPSERPAAEAAPERLLFRDHVVVHQLADKSDVALERAFLLNRQTTQQQDVYSRSESGARVDDGGTGASARFADEPDIAESKVSSTVVTLETKPRPGIAGFFVNENRSQTSTTTFDPKTGKVANKTEGEEVKDPTLNGGAQRGAMAVGGVLGDLVTDAIGANVTKCHRCDAEKIVDAELKSAEQKGAEDKQRVPDRAALLTKELKRLKEQHISVAHTCARRRNNRQRTVDVAQAYVSGMAMDFARHAASSNQTGAAACVAVAAAIGGTALREYFADDDVDEEGVSLRTAAGERLHTATVRHVASGAEAAANIIAAGLQSNYALGGAAAMILGGRAARELLVPDSEDKRSVSEKSADAALAAAQAIGPVAISAENMMGWSSAIGAMVEGINAVRQHLKVAKEKRTLEHTRRLQKGLIAAGSRGVGGYYGFQAGAAIGGYALAWAGPLGATVGGVLGGAVGAVVGGNGAAKISGCGYDKVVAWSDMRWLRTEMKELGIAPDVSERDLYDRFLQKLSDTVNDAAQEGQSQRKVLDRAAKDIAKLAARFDLVLEVRAAVARTEHAEHAELLSEMRQQPDLIAAPPAGDDPGIDSMDCEESSGATSSASPPTSTSSGKAADTKDAGPSNSESEGSLLQMLEVIVAEMEEEIKTNSSDEQTEALQQVKLKRDMVDCVVKGGPCTRYATLCVMLGVGPGASGDEIRAARRAAYLASHPDKGGSSAQFRWVKCMYSLFVLVKCNLDGASEREVRLFQAEEMSLLAFMLREVGHMGETILETALKSFGLEVSRSESAPSHQLQ